MKYALVILFLSDKQQNTLDKWNFILVLIMQFHMSCQWISATKGLVTYHTIMTFCGIWLLVILKLFCTCKCLSTSFAIISSFFTNLRCFLWFVILLKGFSQYLYLTFTTNFGLNEIYHLCLLPASQHYHAHILIQIESSVYHFQCT